MTQSPTTTAAATSTPARANLVGLHVLTGGQPPEETPFVLKTFLAGGAFGQVYSALDEKTGTEVAVKLERYDAKYRQLYLEFGFYQRLGRECPYAPEILFFGQVANAWTALVMEMLGPSLKRVQELLGGALSVQCTTAVAIRLLRHLADFHRHGLIFRDVKPDNFLLGPPASGRAHSLYLIDLGLAKNWRSEADGSHIPFTEGKPLTGTLAYVSLNMHRGFELSRRDDLECLLYMLIHLGTGSLPWFAGDRQVGKDFARKMAYYGDSKRDTPIDEIIGGLPPEYGTLLRKVRALGFEETPEYELYGRLLGKVLTSRGFSGLTAQDRGSAGERSFSRAFDWGPALQIRRSRSKGSSSSSTSTGGKHTEEGGANNSGGSSKERPSMQSKRKSRQRTSSAKRK